MPKMKKAVPRDKSPPARKLSKEMVTHAYESIPLANPAEKRSEKVESVAAMMKAPQSPVVSETSMGNRRTIPA